MTRDVVPAKDPALAHQGVGQKLDLVAEGALTYDSLTAPVAAM